MSKPSFQWEEQFRASLPALVQAGFEEAEADRIISDYLELCAGLPLPRLLQSDKALETLENEGPAIRRIQHIHDFMMHFLEPLLNRFSLEGAAHLNTLPQLAGHTPVTLVSNHLSHFDTALLYAKLIRAGGDAAVIGHRLFFLAGRLVYLSDFSRVATHSFNTLLVTSPRDIEENPEQSRFFKKLNMKSFRTGLQMLKEGSVIVLFPEGTRSRSGAMGAFHDAVYNYLAGSVVIPVGLEGSEKILKAESYTFQYADGTMRIGQPVFLGAADRAPEGIRAFESGKDSNGRREAMNFLGKEIAGLLPDHMRGHYA